MATPDSNRTDTGTKRGQTPREDVRKQRGEQEKRPGGKDRKE